jgi:STE24 endopeptidase
MIAGRWYNRRMQTHQRGDRDSPAPRDGISLAGIADWASWLVLVPTVIVAVRLWLGAGGTFWALAAIAVLCARREATRLYLSSLSPALREAIREQPQKATEDLRELARRQGVSAPAVLYWQEQGLPGGAMAAYFLVHGRPIFLLDERLQQLLSPDEIRSVFAHELAHHLLGHVKLSALASAMADLAAGGFACVAAAGGPFAQRSGWGLAEPVATVFLVWAGARAALQVALHAYSRRQELRADRKALEITGNPAAFVSACRAVASCRGADAEPSRWAHLLFSDSPTLRQRLAVAGAGDTAASPPASPAAGRDQRETPGGDSK